MSAGAIEAGKAFVRIFADDMGLRAGLQRTSAMLKAWAATTTKAGLSLVGAGGSLIAPLAVLAKQAGAYGDNLNDMSTRTGIAADTLGALGYAAEQSGSSLESLASGINKMQIVIAGAEKGTKASVAALKDLGLTVGQLRNLSPDAQFKLIADRLSRIEDPAKRTAAAIKVMGKGAIDLMPLMQDGANGISELQAEAERLGITLADRMAARIGNFDDLIGTATKQLFAFKTVIGSIAASAIMPLLKASQPVIKQIIDWTVANRSLVTTTLLLGAGLIAIGGILVTVGLGANLLLISLGAIGTVGGAIAGAVATGFGLLLTPIGLTAAAVVGLAGTIAYFTGFAGIALKALGDLWGRLRDTAVATWGGIVDAISGGDFALAGKIALLGFEVAWLDTVGRLGVQWTKFSEGFMLVIKTAFTGMVVAFAIATAEIEKLWLKTTQMVGKGWDAIGIGASGLKSLITGDSSGLAGAIGNAAGNEINRQQQGAEAEKAIADRLQATISNAMGKALGDALGSGLNVGGASSDLERRYRQAQDDLNAARSKAAEGRLGDQTGGETLAGVRARMARAKKAAEDAANRMEGGVSRGTLSSFNLQSLNVSPYAKKQEDLAEKANNLLERIVENTEDIGGLDIT